jgi:hypothetical protein
VSGCKAADEYWDKMDELFIYTREVEANGGLYAPADSLWWRDVNDKNDYPNEFWLRGNGWVIAAMAQLLEVLPEDHANREEYEGMLQGMAAALTDDGVQRMDGFWNVNILNSPPDPDPPDRIYGETSGTALITYALAWGLNNNIFEEDKRQRYENAVNKAWNGMLRYAVQNDGELGYVQGRGRLEDPSSPEDPAGPFSPDDSAQNDPKLIFGIGAFLLAGSEVAKLLSVPVCEVKASYYQDGHPPEHTIDGDLSTRWSAEGDGQWIEYDLCSTRNVGYVKIAWYRGDQRIAQFDIKVSSDGIVWSPVYSGESSGTTVDLELYDFNDVTARYVRIVGHGNTQNDWNSITEVEIYGRDDFYNTCPGDFNDDKDVDGLDLVDYLIDSKGLELDVFATNFGKVDCP